MKVVLSFKTPNVIDCATEGMSTNEAGEVRLAAKKFVEYEENIYVELDTEKGTVTVLTT